jgi:hypothetical protein
MVFQINIFMKEKERIKNFVIEINEIKKRRVLKITT